MKIRQREFCHLDGRRLSPSGGLVQRLHREAAGDDAARAMLARVLRYEGVPARFRVPEPGVVRSPLLSLHLRIDGLDLRLFTALTTLDTANDITLQELRIETYFPADAEAAAFFAKPRPSGDRERPVPGAG